LKIKNHKVVRIPDDIQVPSRKFLGNLVLKLNKGGV
jgi:hypothetical protein